MWEADIFNVGGKPGAAIQVNGPEKSLIPLTRSDAQNTRLATRPVTTRAASQMPPRPVLPAGQPAGTRDGNPGPGMLFWRDVVEPLARTRKMYFYIENDERDAAGVSLPFDSRYVIPPVNNPKTTTQFLLMINESWFPGTTTSTDDTHPNVYCIQRNWLPAEDRSGDPLEDRCTLRFDGPMKDLMDQLAVTTHGAIALDLKSAGQIDAFNSGKPVHVLVLDQKYREVFFQAVPHSENERFLWQADIQLIKGKPTATIKFFSGLAAAATQSAAPTH
jgi:hypothetical protein